MARKHHYRKSSKEPPELDITTFLNLMVVLVPFLLISAVFTRITVLDLDMPASAGGAASNKPKVTIEVIVRKNKLQLGNGRSIIANIPNVGDNYDIPRLSQLLERLKNDYPDKEDATVLMEPNIEYQYLVQVMDAIRVKDAPPAAEGEPQKPKKVLFPDISVGDAP
ncbi:MAG: biopolymer transporter ExbD [Gammaproteobacteria bacterium]|nr:biopolymer transporter ExbD [Gammaproteobacteria bacterium]